MKSNLKKELIERLNKRFLHIGQKELSEALIRNLKRYQIKWLIKYLDEQIYEAEGLSEIIQIVIDFDQHKNTLENKELSSYKTVNEIRKELEKPSKRQIKRNKRSDLQSEYEVVYEEEKIIIYFPHSERASCEIANRMGFGGVTWCTASEKSANYFVNYSLDDEVHLYYILSKIDTQSDMNKICIGIECNQIIYEENVTVNSSNKNLNKNDLENHFGKEYWDNISNILLAFNKKYEEHPAINHLTKKHDIAFHTKDKDIQNKLFKNENNLIKIELAANKNLDEKLQLLFSKIEERNILTSFSSNPNLTKDAQLVLVRNENEYARISLARNKNITKDIQSILAKDIYNVKTQLALNTNIDKEIQLILSEDKDTRTFLALNANIDKDIQLILANHEDIDTRICLTRNPNLDKNVQSILAKDENRYIRSSLASNRNLDKFTQWILSQDESYEVKHMLFENQDIDEKIHSILLDYFFSVSPK